MSNEYVLTTDDNGDLAIRTVVAEESSTANSTDVITATTDGKLAVRVVGGGSADTHNKGYFATQAALEEAYPTAEAGDWAIVGATDTVWVWDTDTSAWVDTGTKGQVQSVNGKTGTVVLDAFDVDATAQFETMPTANHGNSGKVVQYVGTTTASYTNGYFYKNVATTTPSSATASQTTGSSLTDVAVVAATFENEITTSGSYAFTSDGSDWSYDGNVVDLTDYGITYTGTPVADDVITVVYTESSTTYAWTRIDVQPSPNPLPSQTGQSGKFLTTDGTDASWSDKPLVNTATGVDSLTILGYATNTTYTVNIGGGSIASYNYSAAFGGLTQTTAFGAIAMGVNVRATATCAIQLGCSYYSYATHTQTNSDANTMKVANANGNYEMMSADGTIPTARLTKVNTTITLAAADWSSNTQTVNVTGMTATGVVMVSPDPTDQSAYTNAGILCTAQAAGSLTFTCDTVPSGDIDVNVVML